MAKHCFVFWFKPFFLRHFFKGSNSSPLPMESVEQAKIQSQLHGYEKYNGSLSQSNFMKCSVFVAELEWFRFGHQSRGLQRFSQSPDSIFTDSVIITQFRWEKLGAMKKLETIDVFFPFLRFFAISGCILAV